MTKERILQVIPSLEKGGAERLVIDICNELCARGIEVALLNFREAMEYSHLLSDVKRVVVPANYIPSLWGKPKANLQGYRKFINDFKPQVIHSHLFEAEMVSRQVIVPGVKYISHFHDNMKQFRKFSFSVLVNKPAATDFFERKLMIGNYRRCHNQFIAVSRYTDEYLRQNLPTDLQRILLLHNAIDYKRFFNPAERTITAPVRLVTIGSLVDNKNQMFQIEVVKLLAENGMSVHLDILGDGPNYRSLNEKIQDLQLTDFIRLRGNVASAEDYLKHAHIYMHSAFSESFGLVQLEAMAAGLPCVVLDAKGNRDIIQNGKNGFLLKTPNPQLFASMIEKLASDVKLYNAVSEYARVFAEAYDIKPYVDRLLAYYQEAGTAA